MTIYKLTFLRDARKDWDGLGVPLQQQFSKKLRERLTNPRIPSAKLRGMPDCYKIKLRSVGYRLVYRVFDDRIVVQVIAVAKRDRNEVYKIAANRL